MYILKNVAFKCTNNILLYFFIKKLSFLLIFFVFDPQQLNALNN